MIKINDTPIIPDKISNIRILEVLKIINNN